MNLMLSEVNSHVKGQLRGDDAKVTSMVIDSRKVVEHALFVALKGEHVDGHDYLDSALEKGASGALVEKYCESQIPQVKVDNCSEAMAALARACRDEYKGKVFGITGSCGKTTSKEMLVSILSVDSKVSYTQGNLNNELGVPLTVCDIDDKSAFAVVEMGAAQMGDIAYLMSIADPDVSVITNVREAHVGRFGSEKNISIGKAEIYSHLSAQRSAAVNVDEIYANGWLDMLKDQSVLTYSIEGKAADLQALNIQPAPDRTDFELSYDGQFHAVSLAVPGVHNVANALCATACALLVGVKISNIVRGLEKFSSFSSRLEKLEGFWGGVLVDDTYNANPAAMKAAIDVLARYPGRKFLVVGDMAELGDDSLAMHAEIGQYASQQNIDQFYCVGTDIRAAAKAFGGDARVFESKADLVKAISEHLSQTDTVLVKGSRSAALEDVVRSLEKKVIQ